MTSTTFHSNSRRCKISLHRNHAAHSQNGVVLIIALILLVVISLLATTSMRNAASSESVAGNVRTTELATQAADIALRHCESSAIKIEKVRGGDTTSAEATYATSMTESNIVRASTSVQWQSTSTWDSGTSTMTYVLPSTAVGTATYKRAPECMIESLTGTTQASASASFVITARGFGPEVASGTGRPQGTEIWLQSTIELN
jgi:Tfp pilus assembly protein PilX